MIELKTHMIIMDKKDARVHSDENAKWNAKDDAALNICVII